MTEKGNSEGQEPHWAGQNDAPGSLAAEIMEIGKRCAALPDLDHRDPDEILGYDEDGLPH